MEGCYHRNVFRYANKLRKPRCIHGDIMPSEGEPTYIIGTKVTSVNDYEANVSKYRRMQAFEII